MTPPLLELSQKFIRFGGAIRPLLRVDWNDFFFRPAMNCLNQTDPELLEFLRTELLWPPFENKDKSSLFESHQQGQARKPRKGR